MDNKTKLCPFCDALEKWKDDVEYYKKPNDEGVDVYSVALVHETFFDDYPGGKVTDYGYTLNYCPVCGKEITHE